MFYSHAGNRMESLHISLEIVWVCERCGHRNVSYVTQTSSDTVAEAVCENPLCGDGHSHVFVDFSLWGTYTDTNDVPLKGK